MESSKQERYFKFSAAPHCEHHKKKNPQTLPPLSVCGRAAVFPILFLTVFELLYFVNCNISKLY